MLLEMLFCTGFFILPLIGMFVMVIAQVMKINKEEQLEQRKQLLSFKRYVHTNERAMLVTTSYLKNKVNTLINELLRVLQLRHLEKYASLPKERINPRAGP